MHGHVVQSFISNSTMSVVAAKGIRQDIEPVVGKCGGPRALHRQVREAWVRGRHMVRWSDRMVDHAARGSIIEHTGRQWRIDWNCWEAMMCHVGAVVVVHCRHREVWASEIAAICLIAWTLNGTILDCGFCVTRVKRPLVHIDAAETCRGRWLDEFASWKRKHWR